MNRFKVGSALLLGLFITGVSGVAMAKNGDGGPGGYSRQGGHGAKGGDYRGQGGYSTSRAYPSHRTHPGYRSYPSYRTYPNYRRYPSYRYYDNVRFSVYIDPYRFAPGYYPPPYYYSPYYYPRAYHPPYYYPPAVITDPATPPVYIERGESEEDSGPAPQGSASWYYCDDPQGYYPYVKQCPGGWQAVAPRPPAPPDDGR